MKIPARVIGMFLWLPLIIHAAETQKMYRWVDDDGVVHFGDSIPAEYSEIERQVVNEHGITVDVMRGKKTEAEIAEEKRQQALRVQRELQRRADMALLATYLSLEEIEMHRDRRVELFQAQARVTELYLRNQQKRLQRLETMASAYKPYSEDPDAKMIYPELAEDLVDARETIKRHQENLKKFHEGEQRIVARFEGDMERFKALKGLN
jgi:hypothetical protein